MNSTRLPRGYSPRVERLEDRTAPALLTVNSTADPGSPGDGLVTLREAIVAANTDGTTDLGETGAGADVIVFAGNVTGAILLNAKNGELPVTADLTIQGPGAGTLSVSGQNLFRVFNIDAAGAAVTFNDFTIADGRFQGDTLGGGGILSNAALTLNRMGMTDNVAVSISGLGTDPDGGAIYSDPGATLVVTDSKFSGNSADGDGSIIFAGPVIMQGSTLSDGGTFSGGEGGMIFASGAVTVTSSTLSGGGTSSGQGGLIFADGAVTVTSSTLSGGGSGFGDGGMISATGAVTVSGSTFSGGGSSDGNGGMIFATGPVSVTSSTFDGGGAFTEHGGMIYADGAAGNVTISSSTFDGGGALSGGMIFADGDVTVDSSALTGGGASNGDGGMILAAGDVSVSNSKLVGAGADGDGGMIFADGGVTVTASTLQGGGASFDGGMIHAGGAVSITDATLQGGGAGDSGGMIFSDGDVTVASSTLEGGGTDGDGGMIYGEAVNLSDLAIIGTSAGGSGGAVHANGPVNLARVSLENNTAGGDGGAVFTFGGGVIVDSTISNNTAGDRGGGVFYSAFDPAVTFTMSNSLVAGNTSTGDGGGVSIAGPAGTERITNVTFVGNTSTAGEGGGFYAGFTAGRPRLVNVTATGNTALTGGGVGSTQGLLLFNSIVAGNTATGPGGFADLLIADSEGGNVIGQADPGSAATFRPSDLTNVANPGLGALGDYGGESQTIRLLAGSPALAHGLPTSDAVLGLPADTAPPIDQRGFPRPSGGAIDAGAFQAQRPTGNPDTFSTPFQRPLTVAPAGVLGNDAAQDPAAPGPLTASLLSGPAAAAGTVSLNPDGSFTFTPAGGFSGAATFTYRMSDGVTSSGVVTVTVTVDQPGPPRVFRYEVTGLPGEAGTVDRVASGEFTGDSIPDIVVGTGVGTPARVTIIDGNARQIMGEVAPFGGEFFGGIFVAAGDVNGDGVDDLAVTADTGGGPRVQVYLNQGGQLVLAADFIALDPGFRGGLRVALGDVNRDGAADLVVTPGEGGGPRVATYDGRTLFGGAVPTRLWNDFFAFEENSRLGAFVAVGDLDGDGFAEVIVGADRGGGPRVAVLSGAALAASGLPATVANFFSGDEGDRGGVRVAARDLDGDGLTEFLTGDGIGSGSTVRVYDGEAVLVTADPVPLFEIDAFPGLTSGVFVA